MCRFFPIHFWVGSAPHLRSLELGAIPFPGLPNLLLSLVNLWLFRIPHSGYFSPEAMATCLSMLTSLESLQLKLESPQSCPDQEIRRSLPPTRSILPALTFFFHSKVPRNTWRSWCLGLISPDSTSCRPRSSMLLTSTPQNSTNSSVARQHSGHMMRRVSSFVVGKLKPVFVKLSPSDLTMDLSRKKSYAKCQIGNFHPWCKSVLCRYIPFNNGEPIHPRGSIFTTQMDA